MKISRSSQADQTGDFPSHYFTHKQREKHRSSHTRSQAIELRGAALQMTSGSGVFSKAGVDEGSALLIEIAQWKSEARVLDLGCGWGAVGCAVAKSSPDACVWLCDINLRATELSRENIRANGLKNAAVWCGDGASSTRSEIFDCVLCNPPVRAGNAVIARLFQDAHRVLNNGGDLWVVLRTAQGAKSWARRMEELFGNCETVTMRSGYRILKSVK